MEIKNNIESFEQAIAILESNSANITELEKTELTKSSIAFLKKQLKIQLIKELAKQAIQIEKMREYLETARAEFTKKMEMEYPEFEADTFVEPKPKMGMTKEVFKANRDNLFAQFEEQEKQRMDQYEQQKLEQQAIFEASSEYQSFKNAQDSINECFEFLGANSIESIVQKIFTEEMTVENSYNEILDACANNMIIEEDGIYVSEKINGKPIFSYSEDGNIELDLEVFLEFLQGVRYAIGEQDRSVIIEDAKAEKEKLAKEQEITHLTEQKESLITDKTTLESKKAELDEKYVQVIADYSEGMLFQAFIGSSGVLPPNEGLRELCGDFLTQIKDGKKIISDYRKHLAELDAEKSKKTFFNKNTVAIQEAEQRITSFEKYNGGIDNIRQLPVEMFKAYARLDILLKHEYRDVYAGMLYGTHGMKMTRTQLWNEIEKANSNQSTSQFCREATPEELQLQDKLSIELEEIFTADEQTYESFLKIINAYEKDIIDYNTSLEEQAKMLTDTKQKTESNRVYVNCQYDGYETLITNITIEISTIDGKIKDIDSRIAQLASEETIETPEVEDLVVTDMVLVEEDAERFSERYSSNDPNSLSFEFMILEAVVKAQNGMLKVEDLNSEFALNTQNTVDTALLTLEEKINSSIPENYPKLRKTL